MHRRTGEWEKGGQLLKVGVFTLVNPDEKHQYRRKADKPFKMICGVPKEFEWINCEAKA